MTPEDIRLLANELIPELQVSNITTYISAGCIGLVGSLLGAYLGANFKKRGELRAIDAHLGSINKQLSQSTMITESIKVSLSEDNWINQQFWNSKEKYYTGLISCLSDLILCTSGKIMLLPKLLVNGQINIDVRKQYQELYEKGKGYSDELNSLRGPAKVFLSQETNDALHQLAENLYNSSFEIDSDDHLRIYSDHVFEAMNIIVYEAKKDLKSRSHQLTR
ncbi:Uncharacterised protein [Serratia quinivorans]|uniref:hypothetical protein n=1 Tax=Serratia quinivorans TaxID=137545 RepID=UPI00217A0C61|nr:hypothetical protein [Serratia quinivorans]CAI0903661.1 Uncharacterised protein [Serratia quinivorans]